MYSFSLGGANYEDLPLTSVLIYFLQKTCNRNIIDARYLPNFFKTCVLYKAHAVQNEECSYQFQNRSLDNYLRGRPFDILGWVNGCVDRGGGCFFFFFLRNKTSIGLKGELKE